MNGSSTLVTGNMGGGKTIYAVEEIAKHVLKGGYIFTNIVLKFEAFKEYCSKRGVIFDPERVKVLEGGDMSEFYKHVGRGTHHLAVMVVFDEAAVAGLNARDWAKLERDMFNFNVLIRKFDIRLIYIAQQPQFVDKQIRGLCSVLIDCRNMQHFRIWGVVPVPLPLFVRVHHNQIGGKVTKNFAEVVTKKKEYYALYDSDALLGNEVAKFCALGVLDGKALTKIEREPSDMGLIFITSLCAAFIVSW